MLALKTKDRHLPQILASSPPLQGGRGLAKHPLSFHPQRCLVVEKMEKKGKENEAEKKRENGRAESFSKNLL